MDNIDESECLRPNEAEAVVRRAAAKGGKSVLYDQSGRMQACVPELPTVLEHMEARDWLTDGEVYAARRFAACQDAFRAQCGAKTARYEAVNFGGGSDVPGMSDDYRRVLRSVSKADCEVAQWAHESYCPRGMWEAVYRERGRIAEALARVGKALDGENNPCA